MDDEGKGTKIRASFDSEKPLCVLLQGGVALSGVRGVVARRTGWLPVQNFGNGVSLKGLKGLGLRVKG